MLPEDIGHEHDGGGQPPPPASTSMEQVFYRLHLRFTLAATRVLSPRVRQWMEHLSLAAAFALAFVLIALHCRFVYVGEADRCLSSYARRHGIDLRTVDIFNVRVVSRKDHSCRRAEVARHAGLENNFCTVGSTFAPASTAPVPSSLTPVVQLGPDYLFPAHMYKVERSYLFSLEKGFLMLPDDKREQHGVMGVNVSVDADSQECFGGPFTRNLLRHFIGYVDTVVVNWLIALYGRGYIYTIQSKELYNLNYAAELLHSSSTLKKYGMFKAGMVLTTLFLFFTTTTLVSFTLRETQERMLRFTHLLQHYVRHRIPYAPLVVTHVVESLIFCPIMVGVLLFLSEFFSDQLLAFMVLCMVWAAEVYSVITVRSSISVRFFPKIFFCYFLLFHIFFFSYPYGFSYLALTTIVMFMQHSMLFFWSRYEVPSILNGTLSSENPRPHGLVPPTQSHDGQGSSANGGEGGSSGDSGESSTPPSPFNLLFSAHMHRTLSLSPYSQRYDQAALLSAASRALLLGGGSRPSSRQQGFSVTCPGMTPTPQFPLGVGDEPFLQREG